MVVPKKTRRQRFKEKKYWRRFRCILSKRWRHSRLNSWKLHKLQGKTNITLEVQSVKHGKRSK